MPKFRYSVLVSILLLIQVAINSALGDEDFNLNEPIGEKELTLRIRAPYPNEKIAGNVRDFTLAITGKLSEPEWVVQLEWARIDPAKDPSIETHGRWSMNTPPNAKTTVPWISNSWPLRTRISRTGFTPGLYAVRAKLQTRPDNTWTEWRKFSIGKATFDMSKLQTGRIGLPSPGKIAPLSPGKSVTRIKRPIKGKTSRKVNTEIVPMDLSSAMSLPPPQRIARSDARTAAMFLKRPSLWINNKKVVATTTPKLNKPFGVSVNLTNLGNAVNGNTSTNKVTIKASCVPLTGGACKTNLSLPVPIIQPGQSRTWGNLQGLFTASQPGKYRVSVSIKSADTPKKIARAGFSRTWSKDFTIKTVSIKPGAPVPGTTKKLIRNPALRR